MGTQWLEFSSQVESKDTLKGKRLFDLNTQGNLFYFLFSPIEFSTDCIATPVGFFSPSTSVLNPVNIFLKDRNALGLLVIIHHGELEQQRNL